MNRATNDPHRQAPQTAPQSAPRDSTTPRLALPRREFLRLSAAGAVSAAGALLAAGRRTWALDEPKSRPKVAAICTVITHRSHAHVILENFLQPYLFNGRRTDPGVDVVSLYFDQTPDGDMSREVARQFDVPIYPTIAEALCQGGDSLAVDAVLAIGEHGRYPTNELGQVEYPRKRFFDEAAAVIRAAGRGVPYFNDKHLPYRWDWAKEMYDTADELHMPLMAGSSVPLAQRRPPFQLPDDAKIEQAVSIHGGGVESYDFHGLEVLQSLVESRSGGETGVSRVEFLSGDKLRQAARDGRWSLDLARTAMEAELGKKLDDPLVVPGQENIEPHGILLTYKDGLSAIVLKVGGSGIRWNFACRLKGEAEPRACAFYVGPWNNRNLFKALSHAIQHHFLHGKAPYAVERTLLVTGVLDAEMHSRHEGGKPVDTPHLEFAYEPRNFDDMREMGATWKIITEDTPEPRGFVLHGLDE
jgi:hypothetical protein